MPITKSVGRGGNNVKHDVMTVQKLLNRAVEGFMIDEDGLVGPTTFAAIDYFQTRYVKIKPALVLPDGATMVVLARMATSPWACDSVTLPGVGKMNALLQADFETAAKMLDCEVAALRAVLAVEAKGSGFFPSGRPKILFEAHVFSRLTSHLFDFVYPRISSKKWNKKLYKGGEAEYDRLIQAMAVDHSAALQAASWGIGQIMGYHYEKLGFASIDAMVAAMYDSEASQLKIFCSFIKASGAQKALKDKNWAAFAAAYNGPGYAENAYDTNLKAAYDKLAPTSSPPATAKPGTPAKPGTAKTAGLPR